ncbi:ErmE/ErmH/ErmO/ErmR family 23S rRNA (adenine(2058)-N(6))-methyltransferase [Streptomonospora nanhaiensis]|uniref:23S rRNA (Adenine-N6)-dimethyltransferase n=1 Tax=Streptomonospora nanhaiensis TaxID=1323731 RepID=A0A853BHY7_9ACTN|nr:ErmE/ErmH/ErmO/ErmR family 23S rRNA (adenine(2058)-N(6))-methyltransferase [Streptomonospora nanhaiensis]MBV2366442.1 ErmE/ErmH/ErmO/ErmR family 23S rRNA (adenine(2058)-N(6))-methyltransferase [Streptomonospora nanhaiensis]MBX9389277.1 ErmE/ErmH/ErmO/ErmR family 23S rRNA (adenine(2058)-N(6))-methyltransferase [Streptomonospora nanhaiensis]NYI94187.1 23S rRNA (adenine-N6)-dimethyltransferase [Streptomonospora nanhaiensis]
MARTPRDRAPRTTSADRGRRTGNRRRYSQNFLTDPAAARTLVRASGVGPADTVVEVGAGDGMITRHLLPACAHLTAYEIDPRLADRLHRRFGARARVVRADFRTAHPPSTPFHVVGNIPYAITADIVDWCLAAPALRTATLITQLEYARKRTGGFGRWSRLTVLHWPHFSWRMGPRISRDRFTPVPRVDSAVLLLRRRPRPLLPARALGDYRRLVETGFTGVGGSLRASLRTAAPARRLDAALAAAGVPRDALVAEVSPDQWITLFTRLHRLPPPQAAD